MIGSTLQVGLAEAQRAYFIGVQKKPDMLTTDPFEPAMTAVLTKRLSAEQQHLIKHIRGLYEQGLTAARKGELITSRCFFQEAEAFLETEAFVTEAQLFSRSLYEAAVAYLDYRNAEFERAIQRLHTALALDLTLAEISGYELIQVHRIRLLLNMLRIQMKRSVAEAMCIGAQIMDYLEQKADISSTHTWNVSHLSAFPPTLKELQFTEAVGDLATLLAGVDRVEAGPCLASLTSHIHSPDADTCYLSPQAHAWLRAKQALVDGQPENFLRQACPILSQGRVSLPQLWYAAVIDLLFLCQSLELSEARMIRKEILASAPSWPWKHFPAVWQTLLRLPAEKQKSTNALERKRAEEYGSIEHIPVPVVNASKTF